MYKILYLLSNILRYIVYIVGFFGRMMIKIKIFVSLLLYMAFFSLLVYMVYQFYSFDGSGKIEKLYKEGKEYKEEIGVVKNVYYPPS